LKHFMLADGSFKLQEILKRNSPHLKQDGNATHVYLAGDIPEISVDELTYFSASVFWRGSIHSWDDDGRVPVQLGPYGEALRSYLDEKSGFPDDVALHVAIRDGGPVSRLTSTPVGKRLGAVRVYKFAMSGLAFTLCVGRGLTEQMRRYCLVRGTGHPMALTAVIEPFLQRDAEIYVQGHQARATRTS